MRVSEDSSLPGQNRALFPQIPPPLLIVRDDPSDRLPVVAAVTTVPQIAASCHPSRYLDSAIALRANCRVPARL